MGISKAGRFAKKRTGGRKKPAKKKRAYEKARPASMTKIGGRRCRLVRVRGGRFKLRALRLNHGNFAWRSEQCTKKTRIIDVAYHPANNEYVRTRTLTKSAVVAIDAIPFKIWYKNHYNIDLSAGTSEEVALDKTLSKDEKEEIEKRRKDRILPKNVEEQFKNGRILAMISSSPGQVGRADGYILEGEELDFYVKKIAARRRK